MRPNQFDLSLQKDIHVAEFQIYLVHYTFQDLVPILLCQHKKNFQPYFYIVKVHFFGVKGVRNFKSFMRFPKWYYFELLEFELFYSSFKSYIKPWVI